MESIPVKLTIEGPITIQGPVTIESLLDETTLAQIFQSMTAAKVVPTTCSQAEADTTGDTSKLPNQGSHQGATSPAGTGQVSSTVRHDKSWDDLEAAKVDIKRLYREVAPVGRRILAYIAEHHEGCRFEDMKLALASERDIQRQMNTVFLTARRMRYVNKQNKGMPPWDTEYPNGRPIYRMPVALAEVIISLQQTSPEA
jgi:hypothetical protein